mmetsp:Transcript_19381/g.24483  ORF Transcript_19381/g.24483 Transcript_19381/m.24483 type:complete len:87 (+) Transcript_19381:414-674(+)
MKFQNGTRYSKMHLTNGVALCMKNKEEENVTKVKFILHSIMIKCGNRASRTLQYMMMTYFAIPSYKNMNKLQKMRYINHYKETNIE